MCVMSRSVGLLREALAGDLDQTSTVLRFYYIDSPPPLTVGLFFIHNHSDGTYSGITEFAEMMPMCNRGYSRRSAHRHLHCCCCHHHQEALLEVIVCMSDGHVPRQIKQVSVLMFRWHFLHQS